MKWLKRILPWPAKRDRAAAVAEASAQLDESRARAARSRELQAQLTRLAHANHYADIIESDILRGRRAQGGP